MTSVPSGVTTSELGSCRTCPRLVALRDTVREQHPDYHAAPVPAWGRADARLLIVGLAPGMHGANRTGRPFTGDASGDFLFAALRAAGYASEPAAAAARLNGVRITNAVKCLPPENRPIASEVNACSAYLRAELAELWHRGVRRPRCVLCLGKIAHDTVARILDDPCPPFAHGATTEVAPRLWVADTYHPSRLNVNTGRLTEPMLADVLSRVGMLLEDALN